jgi:O-antigen ligase
MNRSDRRAFAELPLMALIGAMSWGIGTNWLGEWYYPVRGIGYGDLVFIGWFIFALLSPPRREAMALILWEVRKYILVILAFMTWLLLSTVVNTPAFGADITDLFAILRLLYYCAIILFAYLVVTQYGYGWLVCGFVAGAAILTVGRLYDAYTSGEAAYARQGLIILRDPNVIGNMMGIAVLFCSLGILKGYLKLSLSVALLFAVASITTFSKGTWLMVLVGLLANAVACVMLFRKTDRSLARFVPATVVLFAAVGCLAYQYSGLITALVDFKLQTTSESDTAYYRYQFALAAVYVMVDHPLFGLGFRNFPEVERLYPEVVREPTKNAHNAFLHSGAVGGLPAFALLLLLFALPFAPLSRVVTFEYSRPFALCYTGLVLIVLALSGSVQLQLVAQPFFWLFAGLIFGWHSRVVSRPL